MTARERIAAEERRESILQAALDLFVEKGLAATRTRDIAARAGISEALIYRHFQSKEDLYRQAAQALTSHHPLEPDLAPAVAAGDDEAVFRVVAEHVLHHTRTDGRIITMALRSALEEPVVELMTEQDKGHDSPLGLLINYLAQRHAAGALNCPDPAFYARLFFQMLFMYASEIHIRLTGPPPEVDDREAAARMARLFRQGLKAGK